MKRRDFIKYLGVLIGGGILSPWAERPVAAMGRKSMLDFAALRLGERWNIYPEAGRGLLSEVDHRTSVKTGFKSVAVAIQDKALFDNPLVFLAGDKKFRLPPEKQLKRLGDFLSYGGMLVTDSATGKRGDGFDSSVRSMAKALFPGKTLKKIPFSNTIFKSFYNVSRVAGRLAEANYLEGIVIEDRVAFLHSMNDLHGAWSMDRFGQWVKEPVPGGGPQRRLALALGVNIAVYALTVNYKSDQVHTRYRLMRRYGRK